MRGGSASRHFASTACGSRCGPPESKTTHTSHRPGMYSFPGPDNPIASYRAVGNTRRPTPREPPGRFPGSVPEKWLGDGLHSGISLRILEAFGSAIPSKEVGGEGLGRASKALRAAETALALGSDRHS